MNFPFYIWQNSSAWNLCKAMHINFTSKIPILYRGSCLSSAVVPDIPAVSRTQLSMWTEMQRHLLVLITESKNPQALAREGRDMR
jgi:hypothetical protein